MAWNLEEAMHYYKKQGAPRDQSALVSLLREIQQENNGSIPVYVLSTIADSYEVKESLLLAVIKRIPSLRLSDTHCMELCAGPNCGKHITLAQYAEALQKNTKSFTLKFVPCMRMCGKGPNVKWDGTVYHQADDVLLQKLVDSYKP
jgi:NADH:ubiquinone oxidoreductase subunit E